MYYYHATSEKAFNSILCDGQIKPGFDGLIYLAESKEDAYKFIAFRLFGEPIIILELTIPDNKLLEETFDHSYAFFKCKAFGYPESINFSYVNNVYKYEPN